MRSYATYVCAIGCVADCPCAVRASEVWWDEDGDRPSPRPGGGGEYEVEPGLPCVVFRIDAEHPHPVKHIAVGDDGIVHEWSDGDAACRRYRPCPGCDGMDPACTNNVEVADCEAAHHSAGS